MSTTSGNPIAAAVGENQFSPEQQYGQVEQQAQLTQEAPISGAPMPVQAPGQPAPAASPVPQGSGPAPVAVQPVSPTYYHQLAETWGALAGMPGASPRVKQMAKAARNDAKKGR